MLIDALKVGTKREPKEAYKKTPARGFGRLLFLLPADGVKVSIKIVCSCELVNS
jgi:hypothetical protein